MRKMLLVLMVVAASTALIAAFPSSPEATPAGTIPAALAIPLADVEDSACDTDCQPCSPSTHYAVGVEAPQANALKNDGWHNWPDCRGGTCENSHGGCEEFAADFGTLIESLRRQNVAAIRAILAAHHEIVVLNAERSAIQVKDCTGKGEVSAHLPLAPTLVRALLATAD